MRGIALPSVDSNAVKRGDNRGGCDAPSGLVCGRGL